MRRDYFTLEVRDETKPAVVLTFDGPSRLLDQRLTDADGSALDAEDVDVAFRYTSPVDAEDATGVFSLTNRLTGDFVLETNVAADPIVTLIDAAQSEDASDATNGCYEVAIEREEETVTYDKRTLLVYDTGGDLRREHSLIPGGVEL